MIFFLLFLLFFSIPTLADLLPVEAFGSLPKVQQIKLSPNGEIVAYRGNLNGHTYIASYNIKTQEKKYLVSTDNLKFKISWFKWANDELILIGARYPNKFRSAKFNETRLLKVNASGKGSAGPVFRLKKKDLSPQFQGLDPQFQDRVIDFLPKESDHILMALTLESRLYPSVYKVNIKNKKDKRKLVKRWHPYIKGWMTDRQNRLRLGYGLTDDVGFYRVLDLKTNKWRQIWEYKILEEPSIVPIGFALDPNQLYVRADHNGRAAVFVVDISDTNLPKRLIFADPDYDVDGGLIYSNKTNDVIGIFHGEADGSKVFFDEKFISFQRGLDKAIPEAYNQIYSFSADERKYILYSAENNRPGAFYYGDRDRKSLSFLIDQYPLLYDQNLSGKKQIKFKARDGLSIEGYILLPVEGIKKNNPAIILPHGGPMARDHGGFDWFAEFFASRGYVVLQPNFRGSSGYGFDFAMQSIGDWGGAMQDDLGDAVNWLVENYTVDKNSVCILGGSYGGYAAMMAAVKQQQIFKCAASFAGVSDLNLLLIKARKFHNYDIVEKQIGSDVSKRKNRSPINHAKDIRIPMMLIHGEKDLVVSVDQSRKMVKALQKYDKPVEYIELENGNHNMSIESNRLKVLVHFERFLNKHIPVPES